MTCAKHCGVQIYHCIVYNIDYAYSTMQPQVQKYMQYTHMHSQVSAASPRMCIHYIVHYVHACTVIVCTACMRVHVSIFNLWLHGTVQAHDPKQSQLVGFTSQLICKTWLLCGCFSLKCNNNRYMYNISSN